MMNTIASRTRRSFVLLLLWQLSVAALLARPSDESTLAVHGDLPINERCIKLLNEAERMLAYDPTTALGHAHAGVMLAETSGSIELEHRALRVQGSVERCIGMYAEYLQTTMQALRAAQLMGDPIALALDLEDLSHAYMINQRSDKAVEEARNALAMVLPTQDGAAVERAQLFLMATLERAGRPDEAMAIGHTALERSKSGQTDPDRARISLAMARILVGKGRNNDANPLLARAERVLMAEGTDTERIDLLLVRASSHIAMGAQKEAATLLDNAEALLLRMENHEQRESLLELRYRIALANKQWEQALHALRRWKDRNDSLHHAQVGMKMAGLQVLYQLERKEQDNEELRTQNAHHAETIADQRVNNQYLLGALAVVLVLALGLVLAVRYNLRMMARLKLKNAVVRRLHDEIHNTNLELQRQNLRLAETLISEEEKEMMIKEIHHRVKNNLQVVDSLLSIQGGQHPDEDVRKLFKDAQGRIRSMAMVHEHIFRAGGSLEGSMRKHLEQLSRSILAAYGMHDRVSVSVESIEPEFTVDTLLPFTLVVNELLTNAVKYAFQDREQGHIQVVLRTAGNGYELLFSDDGIGLGETHYLRERSFGLELVKVLAQQLNGQVRLLKGSGTTFSLAFEPDRRPMRLAS